MSARSSVTAIRLAALGFLLAHHLHIPLAHAGPAVAVMPFKDLSSAHSSVGEAIRETVTVDLKEVSGLRVIERGAIDKILAEQNLQSSRTDLDPSSTVKVGKLLGAQLIVAGAYQEVKPKIRLTARFVDVETGQIVGTAKVDGDISQFLSLQDQVTSALLKSAGLSAEVKRFARRPPRAKVKSLRTLDLYGQSLLAQNEDQKKDLLRQALALDPDFTYASKDLDALEERLHGYDAVASTEQARAIKAVQDQLKAEKDPQKYAQTLQNLMNSLMMARQFRRLALLDRIVLGQNDLAPPPTGYPPFKEQAGYQLVTAATMYNDWDAVLREGEKFVAAHPTSMYFGTVRSYMNKAVSEKRFIEQGEKALQQDLAPLSPVERADNCRIIGLYTRNRQWKEARRILSGMKEKVCYTLPIGYFWYQVGIATGDYDIARKSLADMKAAGSDLYYSFQSSEAGFPVE